MINHKFKFTLVMIFMYGSLISSPVMSQTQTLKFMGASIDIVLATFSSITGFGYSNELSSKKTVTFITKEKINKNNAHEILSQIIAPLGGKLEMVGLNSYRIIPQNTKLNVTNSDQKKLISNSTNASNKSIIRLNLQNKIDRRGLEQIVSLDPFLKSIIIVNDGLSKNSVIVSGTKIQINALQNLLSKLSPRTSEKDNSKPPIKNVKNGKMSVANKTKNEVIASKVIDMRFTVAETVVATLEKILNQDGLNNKGSITAHAESNQLILVGKQEWINIVQSLILKIDRQPRQVYVDAIIAEISENSTRNLGLQFSGRSGLVGFAQGSATAGLSQGSVVGNTMLSGLTGGMLAIGGGASALPDLGALLTAIEGDSDNRILATPSLMTLENRESQILVGQNVPFITGQYSAQSGDQNASPFQTIQRKDLGISLKVKPRIGSNNDLILEIKQEVSGIDTNTTGLSDVATKKRELSTVIRARPGETIAIGGLRDAKTEKSSTKVPFFGDLPGIGVLFRQEMVRTINTNLVIFLRPTLMSSKIERIKMFEDKQKELKNSQENSTYFKSEKNPNKIDSKLYDYFRPENRIKSLSPQK